MNKIIVSMAVLSLVFGISCKSTEKKEPVVQTTSVDHSLWVKASNKQLEKIPVEGFQYKGTEVPAQKWDKWAKMSAPVVKKIISELPEGYVLQVKGHTDARGPEDPEGDKPGNIKISTDRAKAVQESLRRQGISSPKLTYKGVGSSELKAGIDPKSAGQRRVTFAVVPE
ncbi:MAG: hypothetical protein CVV44_02945 [Spirochaetae bacterium HGW-Spirochaetae-1]|jgi:flagellar motor protein MotB|nr:MAG: hypothetical protein CVV44_02945 [Spirochaetae bacterium HGW-Spirochaetae-1]